MDNFKIIYKILKILEHSMDLEEFDSSRISREALGLSEAKWCRIMAMIVGKGYVEGVAVWKSLDSYYPRVYLVRSEITITGLEYLKKNKLMKKAAKLHRCNGEEVTDIVRQNDCRSPARLHGFKGKTLGH